MAFSSDIGTPFCNFPTPPDWFGKFYDFLSDEEITEGVFTAISSGTNTVLDTLNGGYMRIASNGAADDSGGEWQLDSFGCTVESGKRIQMMYKGRINDVTESDFRFGLFKSDQSIIAGITDGIMFRKDDGDALLDCSLWVGSAEVFSQVGVATLVNATDFYLGIEIIPTAEAVATVDFYTYNPTTKVATKVASGALTLASTALLAPAVCGQSGAAASTTFDTDYVGFRKQR